MLARQSQCRRLIILLHVTHFYFHLDLAEMILTKKKIVDIYLSNYNTCKLSADIASPMSGELQTCLKSCRRKAASSTASAAKKSVIKVKNDI